MVEELTEQDIDEYEQQYDARKASLQQVIDILAQHDKGEIEAFGGKAHIAEENDIETHRIQYVLDRWDHLVKWRRHQLADPLDPDAVKAAYDDETMKAMAGEGLVADGMGEVTVNVTYSLDEAFRVVKLLPGDLGITTFGQIMEQAGEIPKADLVEALRRE